MNSAPRAIDTAYSNCVFRSRLEARWAVFLKTMRFEWQYEPEGFELPSGRYLPDFWLPRVKMWAEVKPGPFSDLEISKVKELAKASGHPVILLDGPPDIRTYWFYDPSEERFIDLLWDEGSNYYFSENRFYTNTGSGTFPQIWKLAGSLSENVHDAVAAALSARFEFGESGNAKRSLTRSIFNR